MHILDPERPIIAGLPSWITAPMPTTISALHVSPRGTPDAFEWEVSAFFPLGSGGCTRRAVNMTGAALSAFMAQWANDPEATALSVFGWDGVVERGRRAAPAPTKPLTPDLASILDSIT